MANRHAFKLFAALLLSIGSMHSAVAQHPNLDTVVVGQKYAYLADSTKSYTAGDIDLFKFPNAALRRAILDSSRSTNVDYSRYACTEITFEVDWRHDAFRTVFATDEDSSGRDINHSVLSDDWAVAPEGSIAAGIIRYYEDHESDWPPSGAGWDTLGVSEQTIYITRPGQEFSKGSVVVVRQIPLPHTMTAARDTAAKYAPQLDFSHYAYTDLAYTVDCGSHRYKLVLGTDCDSAGKAIRTHEFNEEWQATKWGTIADRVVQFYCRRSLQ